MKSIFVIMLFTFVIGSDPWLTDFEKAQTEAKNSNKYILLNFSGSDWCAPCIQMKKNIFETEQFLEYATAHLVLVRADFPRQKKHQLPVQLKEHNERLADTYNKDGKFPFTLLLDAQGKVIHQWDGYRDATAELFLNEVTSKLHDK
jgi:thioredoxin-related protein